MTQYTSENAIQGTVSPYQPNNFRKHKYKLIQTNKILGNKVTF